MARVSNAGAAALAADYVDRLLVGTVRDVHRAVSRRTFGLTGSRGALARVAHDGISGTVYGLIGVGVRGAATALRELDRRGRGGALEDRPAGRRVASVVNGLIGETLQESAHPMAIRMAARVDGRDVAVSDAYPRATGDVVVFLHGLVEDDESWLRDAELTGGTYAERLARDTSWTPVTLRYNSGLRLVENGRLLSAWLTDLLADWPVPVRRIAVVGHSMGGLVAHAATRVGAADDAPWTALVRQVVCLGTPHLGAPLERAVHLGVRGLGALPETRPFATILDTRSPGILDLGVGDPDGVPLPATSYHCISGTLPNPWGYLFGDLLVTRRSAAGRIAGSTSRHLTGVHHFRLLNHPEVYADLRDLLHDPPPKETTR
ncbi:MAG: esterase/lipase family protein [Nocardioidaceae bacterium]